MTKRTKNPKSHLWETEEGKDWLPQMVPATVLRASENKTSRLVAVRF